MKVSELEGAELDYWVAKAEGFEAVMHDDMCFADPHDVMNYKAMLDGADYKAAAGDPLYYQYSPSEEWKDCGPLIEKYGVSLDMRQSGKWDGIASKTNADVKWMNYCNTPQQAICRAVVASVYGDEVDE